MAGAFRPAALAFGGVDLVVSNAGLSISRPLLETTVADWDLQHDVMARGSFLVAREAARVMPAQGLGGDIIYICSKNAVFAGPNNVAYGAAKADQAHQVRLLAAELGGYGIRVNGINPDGVVRGSGIFAGGWGAQRAAVYGVPEEELGAFYAQRTLLKREVLPEHVAAAVVALTAGDLCPDHRAAHPGGRRRGRRVPALRRPGGDGRERGPAPGRRGPRRVRRPGHGRPGVGGRLTGRAGAGRRRTGSSCTRCTGSPNTPVRVRRHAALGHPARCTRACSTGWRAAARSRAGQRGHRLVGGGLRPARRGRGPARQPGALPGQPDRRRAGRRCWPRCQRRSCTRSPGSSSCRSTRSTSWPPRRGPGSWPRPRTLLLIPDLLAYWLTGEIGAERDQRVHHPAVRRRGPGLGLGPDRRGSACPPGCSRRCASPAA